MTDRQTDRQRMLFSCLEDSESLIRDCISCVLCFSLAGVCVCVCVCACVRVCVCVCVCG